MHAETEPSAGALTSSSYSGGFQPRWGEYLSRNDDKPVLQQGYIERLIGTMMQIEGFLERRVERPKVGTNDWERQVNNELWSREFLKSHSQVFKILNNPFLYEFLQKVLRFTYLRDGTVIDRNMLAELGDGRKGGFGQVSSLEGWAAAVATKVHCLDSDVGFRDVGEVARHAVCRFAR